MRAPRPLIAALSAVFLLSPPAHANCGAEGCPFVRDSFGASRGKYSFDMRYQNVIQDQLWDGDSKTTIEDVLAGAERHGEVELYTKSQSWVGEGHAQVTRDLRLVAVLPYIWRTHQHMLAHVPVFDPRFVNTWNYEGLGDMTVVADYKLLKHAGWPAVSVQGGVKLPTGKTHVPGETQDNFGFESTLEPSARPGTGSTDWITGAFITQQLPGRGMLPLTASVLAKWTGKGTDDFEVGNELQAGLSTGWSPKPWMTLLGQVNFSGHGSDVSAQETETAHSAMEALYVTPGASVRVSPAMIVYGIYQARVWGHTDEATIVGNNHYMFGATYSLGH